MTTKYIFENYEITLSLTVDNVSIHILDTKLYQLYRKSYSDIHIIDYCPNIDIFYTVLQTSFECLSTNDMTKSDINIRSSSTGLTIHINHKFYVRFTFDLQLDLDKSTTLSAKELCIKKLENDIKSLTSDFNALRHFIDDYMEVTITNNQLVLKVNTIQINITFNNNGECANYTIDETNNICNMNMGNGNTIYFNKNFKIINCDKIVMKNFRDHHFIRNIPESLKEIILENSTTTNFKEYIKTVNLTKLIQLEFIGCTELTKIYEDIKHLKIKKIRMTRCPNFQERDVLLTNGYKFEVY